MAEKTKIEWADHTFNPWEGCQKVGPGCDNCYAETRNARFSGGQAVNWGPGAPRRRTSESNWNKPLAWDRNHGQFFAEHGRRQRVFCASLADWLDNGVPIEWLADLLALVNATPNLDWLLLTKRIGNWMDRVFDAARILDRRGDVGGGSTADMIEGWIQNQPPENVWVGATVVNQKEADRDIPKLLAVPARIRFLSMEPLLGPVMLTSQGDIPADDEGPDRVGYMVGPDDGKSGLWVTPADALKRSGIDWVIVGGESGPGARPIHPDWARSLRDQCQAAGVPFLFKQWGEWVPRGPESMGYPLVDGVSRVRLTDLGENGSDLGGEGDNHVWMHRAGKKAAGRLLDGRTWDQFPTGAA